MVAFEHTGALREALMNLCVVCGGVTTAAR